jgi:hypothetical protein
VDDLVPGSLKGLVYVFIKPNHKKVIVVCGAIFSIYYRCGDNMCSCLVIIFLFFSSFIFFSFLLSFIIFSFLSLNFFFFFNILTAQSRGQEIEALQHMTHISGTDHAPANCNLSSFAVVELTHPKRNPIDSNRKVCTCSSMNKLYIYFSYRARNFIISFHQSCPSLRSATLFEQTH